jgi:membrane protease YdiL (CAAX protease family)
VLILLGSVAAQAIVVAIFAWRGWRASAGPPRPGPGRAALVGVGAFALVWPLVATTALASGLLARLITDEPVPPIAHETLLVLVESPTGGWLVAMIGMVLVAVPVLEEVMYRGILQQTLVEVTGGRWTGILITSVIFTMMHWGAVQWHALPPLFVLSLGFGWIYERTGRLSSCIAMHILFNAVNVVLAWISTPAT